MTGRGRDWAATKRRRFDAAESAALGGRVVEAVRDPIPFGLRSTAVLMLRREERLPPCVIARRLGLTQRSVWSILARAKYAGARSTVQFPNEVLQTLVPHAARRGVSVSGLVRQIVEQVGSGGIVDEVLDDCGTESAPAAVGGV